MSVVPALSALEARVPFLGWRIGSPVDGDVTGAPRLAVLDASSAYWGSDDRTVLLSLWWQAYAYRVAGTALACWSLTGIGPDVSLLGCGAGTTDGRPSSLLLASDDAVADVDDVVQRAVVHLTPIVEDVKALVPIGTQLLWGNVASAVSSVLGAVGGPRRRVVIDALPANVRDLADWDADPFRRRTCCLWFRTTTADGALCADCSLRS